MADEPIQTPEGDETGDSPLDTLYTPPADEQVEPTDPPEPKDTDEPGDGDEPKPDDAPAEPDEVEISSFTELADHFEFDAEWAQNLKVPVKVNGQTSEASISELVSSYQIGRATEAELETAKKKASEILAEVNQQREQAGATLSAFSELLQEEEQAIERDSKAVDWAKLREDDPAEYSARKEEFRERRQRHEERKESAQQKYRDYVQQSREQQNAALNERLPKEHEMFLERIPEWSDDTNAEAERPEVIKYLQSDGYTDEEIKVAAYNGKLLALVVKAMRYDKSKSKAKSAKKKAVRKVPKVMKPGSKSKPDPKPNGADKSDDPVSILYPG